MNSDSLTPDTLPAATAEEKTTPRRRSTRRPAGTTAATPSVEATTAAETPTAEAAEEPAPRATRGTRRSRARTTPSAETADQTPAGVAETVAPPIAETIMPLSTGDAFVAPDVADQVMSEEPLPRPRRRRRGRGGHGTATEETEAAAPELAMDIAEAAPAPMAPAELEPAAAAESLDQAEAGTAAPRRRRRRGRGGRGAAETEVTLSDEVEVMASTDELAEPDLATPEPEQSILSSAVLRRFDHRDWRDRAGRGAAPARAPYRPAASAAPSHEPVEPVPFARTERPPRYGERQSARFTRELPAQAPPALEPMAPSIAPTMTPPPIVMPTPAAPPASAIVQPGPATPFVPGGGSLDERLERFIANQAAMLQQQQQLLQSMAATMSALQATIERMTTSGIAAGMPRAGIFVDAPNVVYAAESARVAIDYGRMLDFLGRGREMVHAIVYAPVTEESGYRFEGQRFVAPFLKKGYKLVTKPLKRFPDGTAKGNFDIELAIDIVTMSQRLDVVILISGDSDFSRLIELIQSRGVRVEVVAFASNVSWELVQMADVFIDIGEYLHEFRPV